MRTIVGLLLLVLAMPVSAETRPPRVTMTPPTQYVDGAPLAPVVELAAAQTQCSADPGFSVLVIDEADENGVSDWSVLAGGQWQQFLDVGLPNSSTHYCRVRVAIFDQIAGAYLWSDWSNVDDVKIRGKSLSPIVTV